MLEPQHFLNPRPVARLPRMSKRPYEDVDQNPEDLGEDVYTGGMGRRRREVAREMEELGLGSTLVLPMPVDMQPPYDSAPRPGIEALEVSALATVMSTSQFQSSPAAGAASSIDAAVQDDTASGRDTAPVPDRDTASGQDAAPLPDRGTASGQGAAPRPDGETASHQDWNPFASGQDVPANPDRDTASGQVAPAQDADMQDAPPQEADRQTAAPQTEEMIDKKGYHWRLDNARKI